MFTRQKRRINLTPQGHRFKLYAERLIAEWRKARHEGGMQEWVHDIHRKYPELALILESHTPETLIRRLLDGQLDLGFFMEPPQIDLLEIVEVAELDLCMVSTHADQDVTVAMGDGYITIDWG